MKLKPCPVCDFECVPSLLICKNCGYDNFLFDAFDNPIESPDNPDYYEYVGRYRALWLKKLESQKIERLNIAANYEKFAKEFQEKRDFSQAVDNYKKALKTKEEVLDKDDPEVIKTYKDIASAYMLRDNIAHRKKAAKTAAGTKKTATSPIYVDKTLLFAEMQEKIIGQSDSLRKLALITKIHLSKYKLRRPATIFFAGATGIGKSQSVLELVDALNELTNIKFTLIRVDCNQYMESHRVSNLLGAPAGYRNSGSKNILTPLLDNPRCILLFDEIEKAHGSVLDALMSAMDHGIIQLSTPTEGDPDGRMELDCRYSIICFTSNLPLDAKTKTVGFFNDSADSELLSEDDLCKEALVKNGFRPEIAGRINCFLRYQPLSPEDIKKVIRLEIEQCANSYGLLTRQVGDAIIDEIAEASGSKFGMRAFKQLIERKMGEAFADFAEANGNSRVVALAGGLDSVEVSIYVAEEGEEEDWEFIDLDEFDDEEDYPF
jgi:ATP-dependent Clp protease ATP-binding subunit ClpA